MPASKAWRKANPNWRNGRDPDKIKPWELKTIPEFYWDGEYLGSMSIWFRCPHMPNFLKLDPTKFTVDEYDPVTIRETIQRNECGCHGKITDGVWYPNSGESS